ncbi:superoxide dismutase [Cryptosporangium phraense]|uniref:Superoxide dismutase n=1 Tax=Cryptosporangium phraense TaxID=2593070 RepID=A0A545AVM0_9ACTN|nr:superoxide dismutase [Cryptosporangium phraense]TQS45376.1 superoxide dismutase [Cryptosporangium phraense]
MTARPESAQPGAAVRAATDAAQRAAGVVAARRRGDDAGAEALLKSFPDEAAKAGGFFVLADLAIALLASASRQSTDEVVQDLTILLAANASVPD